MKLLFLFFLLPLSNILYAQTNVIKGVVIGADGETPLANCNVFIDNSSKGTITDAGGRFTLSQIPDGNAVILLVSNAGYETYTYTFATKQLPLDLTIKLNKKIVGLQNVIITATDPNGWENWGEEFTKQFIGQSQDAKSCKIENPEVLKFRYSKKENKLDVSADEILIIKNYRLGYIIKYQLENFTYNMNAQTVRYLGYPLFEEMEPNIAGRDQYIKRRLKAYKGSIMHFMRSLYSNQLSAEGYKVIKKDLEPGYGILGNDGRTIQINITSDELKKNKRSNEEDQEQKVKTEKRLLTRNDVLFKGSDSVRNVLTFDNYLSITIAKPEEEGYNMFPEYKQKSELSILNDDKKIFVEPNGHYYPALDIVIQGYMAWKKVGDQLPYDYEPPESKKHK